MKITKVIYSFLNTYKIHIKLSIIFFIGGITNFTRKNSASNSAPS